MKSPKILSVTFCTILFFSCSKPLDFDQLNQYSPEQVISVPFVLFTVNDTDFETPAGQPLDSIFEKSDFKILDGEFFQKSLVKLDFDFEIKNGIDRDFTIKVILRELDLDNSNSSITGLEVHTIPLKVTASNTNFIEQVVVTAEDVPGLSKFQRVEVRLVLDSSGPIKSSQLGDLEFKSGITIHLKTKL